MECFSQILYIVELQYTHVASLDPTEDSTIVVLYVPWQLWHTLSFLDMLKFEIFIFEEQVFVKENEESFEILRILFFFKMKSSKLINDLADMCC